jgi:hypothetical protein
MDEQVISPSAEEDVDNEFIFTKSLTLAGIIPYNVSSLKVRNIN